MLKEIRSKFINYFKNKDHFVQESYPLTPKNDKSILFINSGMAPMKSYFLNETTPPSKRIVTAQKCLRVGGKHNDLADIGYSKRHHTFFEMLGNFSFGDYFKKDAIDYAWDFLINELKLDKERLYITVHPEDEEAISYWKNHINEERITKLAANIWTMGDIGPWGYCSEIFYDLKEGEGNLEEGDRYLEIWNLVFTQFCNDGTKNFTLDFPCIDTGIGLERIVSVLEGKTDNYEINFFKKALKCLGKTSHNSHTKIFLDHLRAVAALITEDVTPGPSQEGYVLRRLIRRMLRSFYTFENLNLNKTVKEIFAQWKEEYQFNETKVLEVLEKENQSFQNTINEGLKRFESMFQSNHISAQDIFLLHDTYGLTFDIVHDLIKEKGGSGDFEGFDLLMEEAKQKNQKEKIQLDYPETKFIDKTELDATLIGIHENYLIFDQTIFYAEGGGQIGDTGQIKGQTFTAKIVDTKKFNKVYCHEYELIDGTIEIGQKIHQKLDKTRRRKIEAHHSCSHLLQYVLEKLYGEGIQQMGSFVSDKKFREDFSFPNVTPDLKKIEEEINKLIEEAVETEIEYMSLNEARKKGAKAFFEYEDIVRVLKVGPSLELCGGTHIKNTSNILKCKMLKVSPVKNGVKRFEGIAGEAYLEYLMEESELLESGLTILKCNQANFINALKKATKEKIPAKLEYQKEINGIKLGVIVGNEEDSIESLMDKFKLDIACLYVEKETKCNIKIKSKIKDQSAKELIKNIAQIINSKGGGGNPEFAQTGGEKQESLEEIYKILVELISQSTNKI